MKRVTFTYFKESGKYYSEGTKEYPEEVMWWDMIDHIKSDLNRGIWPGLIGPDEFNVLITGTDNTGDMVPHLILRSQLQKDLPV